MNVHRAQFTSLEWYWLLAYQYREEELPTIATCHGSPSRDFQVTPFHWKRRNRQIWPMGSRKEMQQDLERDDNK